MRYRSAAICALFLVLSTGCKSKAEGDATASGEAKASARARIGGTVIATGNYAVEVLLHESGLIEALVVDANGKLVADPESVKLGITAEGKTGARTSISMKWDPVRSRFVGHTATGVQLAPGAVDIGLDVRGTTAVSHAAYVAIAVDASRGGQIIMVGDYSVELVAKGGVVQAFVFDALGKAHVQGDLDLKIDIDGKPIVLVWDPPSLSYRAKLEGGLDLDAKPVVVRLTAGGRALVGTVQSFKADVAVAGNVAAAVDAKAVAAINVKAPDLSAQVEGVKAAAASAKASIKPPTVDLRVNKSASAGTTAGTGAKGSAKVGFSLGSK